MMYIWNTFKLPQCRDTFAVVSNIRVQQMVKNNLICIRYRNRNYINNKILEKIFKRIKNTHINNYKKVTDQPSEI